MRSLFFEYASRYVFANVPLLPLEEICSKDLAAVGRLYVSNQPRQADGVEKTVTGKTPNHFAVDKNEDCAEYPEQQDQFRPFLASS
jgi:hypothetical protein